MKAANTKGVLFGVGVGPGDPMLLTLKADDVIGQADVIAYISNKEGHSLAKSIAQNSIDKKARSSFKDLSVALTMNTDRTAINQMYDTAAESIAVYLEEGKNVAFLCEGDPMFFGSFAYLLARLADKHKIEVIPGICSVHAAAAACKVPLGLLTERIAIFSGRHSNEEVLHGLNSFENVVILKAGRGRAELISLIEQADRISETCYVEYASQTEQKIVNDITALKDEAGPYFSLFLVNANRDYR